MGGTAPFVGHRDTTPSCRMLWTSLGSGSIGVLRVYPTRPRGIHLDDVRRTLFQSLSLRRAGVRALRATHLTLGQGLHILKSAHRAGPVLLFSVFDRPCKAVRLDRSKRRRCAWLSPLLLLLLLWPLLGRLKGLLLRLRLCMIGSRRCPIFTRLQLDLHEPTCILGYSGRVRLCSSLLQSTNLFLLLCNGCFETFSLLDQGSYSRVSSLFLRVRLRDLPTSSEHRALQPYLGTRPYKYTSTSQRCTQCQGSPKDQRQQRSSGARTLYKCLTLQAQRLRLRLPIP